MILDEIWLPDRWVVECDQQLTVDRGLVYSN